MFVCICARVRDCEVRDVIRCGARCIESVGEASDAGTGCGSCHDRIAEMIQEETADTLVGVSA
ncbi:(2Fe-2S)-binding protein [Catelliglobosispora koreensis]|uniref:(2Fe-2S)-binding protein n=1 Tax=Catelliglobosispora koreensis TaxID=129052 RepID=UPI0003A7C213|nr:(2Fe-2S)-binding protein [Catelliglobosispora koreensis]